MDLSSPDIERAYALVVNPGSKIDWLILGLKGNSTESIDLEAFGEGIDALKVKLSGEIQFGILQLENSLLFWTMIPPSVRGAKRAKLLVNIRQIYSVFRAQATFNFSSVSEFTLSAARQKLKPVDVLPRSTYSSPTIPSPPRSLSSSPLPPVSPEPEIQSPIIIPPDLPHKPSHTLSERGQRISMAPHSPLLRNTSTLRPQSSVTLTYTPDDDLPDHYESPTILESTLSRNVSQNSLTTTETSIPVIVEESTPRTPSKDIKDITSSSIPSSPSSNSLLVSPSAVQKRQFSLKRKKVPGYENADKDLPLPAKEEIEVGLKVEAVVLIQEKELPLVIDEVAELKVDNIVLDEKEEEEKEELMRKNREKLAWEVIDRARQHAQDERTRREEEEELVAGSKEIYVDATESLSSVHSETQSGEISLVPQTEIDATAEREWLEEQERDREACEVLDLLFEQQTLARRLKEIEELQWKEEKRRKDLLNMRRKFEALRKSGEVMLSGWISVKKGDTVMYRRRRYELQADKLSLYRSEFELTNPTDSILTHQIKSVEHHFNPEDSAIRHSFKLVTSEQDWSLFMDEKEEKEFFIIALELAIKRA